MWGWWCHVEIHTIRFLVTYAALNLYAFILYCTYVSQYVHESEACAFIHSSGFCEKHYVLASCTAYWGISCDIHLPHSELSSVRRVSAGNQPDKESWYMASAGPIGGSRWQIPLCLLIYALSFGSLFLTFCASRGWKVHLGAGLRFCIRTYSREAHEYLICRATITHRTSA